MDNLYYYRYKKKTNTVQLVEILNDFVSREIVDNELVYCTYSKDTPAEALLDIMNYINKRRLKNVISVSKVILE